MELVHLGNWIANSDNDPDTTNEYNEVTSLIYSYGPKANLEKYVGYSKNSKAWVATNDLYFGSNAAKLLEEYNDRNFWSHFIESLALKDFYNKYSEAKIKKMSSQERFEKVYELMDKYTAESYDRDIDRFEILKRIPKGK